MNKIYKSYLLLGLLLAGSLFANENLEVRPNFLKTCRYGTLDEVVALVNRGADVNTCDSYGYTALIELMYRSCNDECFNILQFLLEHGADVNQANNFGTTVLIKAADHHSYTCRCHVIKLLLQHGADVNACDKCGYTALMIAASNGHLQSVQLLLAAGANVHAQTIYGKTALNICQRSSYSGRFGWDDKGKAVIKLLKAAAKKRIN